MLRKNQRPFVFSVGHTQQLRRSAHSLREVNRAALRELRRIGSTDLTHTQYREASESVGISASRMILLLRHRQEILVTGREQGPQSIQLIFSSDCENCAEIRRLEPGCNEPVSEETLENDPGYQKEIESLLELALRTEKRVFARHKLGRAVPSMFFAKVGSLISAVIRQQQQLRDMTIIRQEPQIEICFEECASCASPIKTNEQENED